MLLVLVDALIHLKSWHPDQTLARLQGLKGQIWALDRLIRPFIFFSVNLKMDTPLTRGGLRHLMNQVFILALD